MNLFGNMPTISNTDKKSKKKLPKPKLGLRIKQSQIMFSIIIKILELETRQWLQSTLRFKEFLECLYITLFQDVWNIAHPDCYPTWRQKVKITHEFAKKVKNIFILTPSVSIRSPDKKMNIPKTYLCDFKLQKLRKKAFVKREVPKYTRAQ